MGKSSIEVSDEFRRALAHTVPKAVTYEEWLRERVEDDLHWPDEPADKAEE